MLAELRDQRSGKHAPASERDASFHPAGSGR